MAPSLRTTLLSLLALPLLSTAAIIKVTADAAYDNSFGEVFRFVPNEIIAGVGDTLEFHFAGPGQGVLGGNHSVAMGVFGQPCMPAPTGFFSGYMEVNATSTESDMVFLVDVTTSDPMVFYCTQGRHCGMGMFGVVNGRGDQTRKAYKDSIPTVNLFATAPDVVGGGTWQPNNVSNILPATFTGAGVRATGRALGLGGVLGSMGLAAGIVVGVSGL